MLGVLYYGRIGCMVNFLLVHVSDIYCTHFGCAFVILAFGLKCSHTILSSRSEAFQDSSLYVHCPSVTLHTFTCYFVKHSFV